MFAQTTGLEGANAVVFDWLTLFWSCWGILFKLSLSVAVCLISTGYSRLYLFVFEHDHIVHANLIAVYGVI